MGRKSQHQTPTLGLIPGWLPWTNWSNSEAPKRREVVFLVWSQYGALKITKTSTIIPFFLGPISLKLPKKRTQMKSRLEICMEGYAKNRLDHFNLSIHSSTWFHQQPICSTCRYASRLPQWRLSANPKKANNWTQQSNKSSHFLGVSKSLFGMFF